MRQLYIGRWVKGFRKFYELGRKFNLSPEAQHRLLVITYYFNKSNQNADKTARYFGLHRNTINNWLQLYDPNDLIKLEPKKSAPIRTYRKKTPDLIVQKIVKIKKEFIYLGKNKIKIILLRDYQIEISASTIGRVLQNYKLTYLWRTPESACNFKKTIKKRKKKKRPPKKIFPKKPGQWIQIDTVRIYFNGISVYVINAIDLCSRFAFSYAYPSPSSGNAKDFLEKLSIFFPSKFKIKMVQTDNGSEFMKCFDKACDQMNIEHTFSYVKCPKMNSYVESYNGYIQRECLLKKDAISNLNILNCKIMEYLIIYNTFRPHGSLDYKTPLEVYSQYWNNSTKLHKEMWTHTLQTIPFPSPNILDIINI